jgi:hypothetical protein
MISPTAIDRVCDDQSDSILKLSPLKHRGSGSTSSTKTSLPHYKSLALKGISLASLETVL